MVNWIGFGVALAACGIGLVATRLSAADATGAALLVATENAFCDAAKQRGIEAAFMEFLADSGMILSPVPVNGKEVYSTPPDPNSRQSLVWAPAKAEMAANGDFGYTTGPYWFYPNVEDSATYRSGHYTSVWMKQSDGTFKAIIDGGVPHEAVPREVPKPRLLESRHVGDATTNDGKTRHDVLTALHALDLSAHTDTAGDNTMSLAAEDIRVNRFGLLPVEGIARARELTAEDTGSYKRQPTGGEVASSLDLALTYGTVVPNAETTGDTTRGGYMRIWRVNEFGNWQIALDVLLPPQPPRPAEQPASN